MQKLGLKALVFGGTGAVGSELVQILLASKNWQKVTCVVRKRLEEWENLPGKQKLEVEIHEDLDVYFKQENNKYVGYDTVFSSFGSLMKHGEDLFVKVDKTYPLYVADIAIKNKIPHYILVSSGKADPNSWFMYLRVKGEAEEQLKAKKMNWLTISKPGVLINRKDPRTLQKVFGVCPCVLKIQAKQCAEALRITAEKYNTESYNSRQKVYLLQNGEMLEMVNK